LLTNASRHNYCLLWPQKLGTPDAPTSSVSIAYLVKRAPENEGIRPENVSKPLLAQVLEAKMKSVNLASERFYKSPSHKT